LNSACTKYCASGCRFINACTWSGTNGVLTYYR
jgi:hypothetical protein